MRIVCFSRLGYAGEIITVEADLRRGIPAVDIVGLPDGAVREARERMRAAIRNSGLEFPRERILINLSPADIRKEGSGFDLAIALSVISALQSPKKPDTIEAIDTSQSIMILGELELSGRVRPVRGVLAAVARGKKEGILHYIVPQENRDEALLTPAVNVQSVSSLMEALHRFCAISSGEVEHSHARIVEQELNPESSWTTSISGFEDIRGQEQLIRGLQIAAAGGHNLCAYGPPGCGKTLAIGRFPSILPDLDTATALTVTRIYSIAGLLGESAAREYPLMIRPPFREPHQNASLEGMTGGGRLHVPGEVSLAHGGVLFLDEASQFKSTVLQSLRTPLETGVVTLSRAGRTDTFPARFQLLMAINPCPCGNFGSRGHSCTCTAESIERYWKRLTAPLLDRIDIRIAVDSPDARTMTSCENGASTIVLREGIARARAMQRRRNNSEGGLILNAYLEPEKIHSVCRLNTKTEPLFRTEMNKAQLSGRGAHRVLTLARTIADIEQKTEIEEEHLKEAFTFRKWSGIVPDFLLS